MDKSTRLTHEDLLVLHALFQHHYLSFQTIQQIYSLSADRTRKRLLKLRKENYVVRFEIGNRNKQTHEIIYGLDKGGYFSIVGNTKHFKEDDAYRLKKGYRHHMVAAEILYAFKKQNKRVEIFSERDAYHFYGDKKNYHDVIRPDGAVVNQSYCMFIEYENEQKNRSFEQKLERYERYKRNGLLRKHPIIESDIFSIIFIFNTQFKMENAIRKLQKIEMLKELQVSCTTLDKVLNTPFQENIYNIVEYKI